MADDDVRISRWNLRATAGTSTLNWLLIEPV